MVIKKLSCTKVLLVLIFTDFIITAPVFQKSPDTIENNARSLVKKLKDEGLTVERYLVMCLSSASLFARSPESIENNFMGTLFLYKNLYSGLSDTELLDKISANITLLTSRPERSYDRLLCKRMTQHYGAKGLTRSSRFREKLINYLKAHPGSSYKFSVINDKRTQDFIEYAKSLGIEALGRDNVFDITVE